MDAQSHLDDLTHDELRAWLQRALGGREHLPLAQPGEAPHLAIARLSKGLKPLTRESLREGCIALVHEFCEDGSGGDSYMEELLSLASTFKTEEVIPTLAELARRFPEWPGITETVRLAVLATLIDTPPRQSIGFWEDIFAQNPDLYAGRALSGLLATNHASVVELLPKMPDTERRGRATALKLELAWGDLPTNQRIPFVESIRSVLGSCGLSFAGPLKAWIDSKEVSKAALDPKPLAASAHPLLAAALRQVLGPGESVAKHHTPKLAVAA